MKNWVMAISGFAALGLPVLGQVALAQADGQPTGPQAQPASAPPPAVLLANALRTEIGARAATASPQDLEGLIIFALSQNDYSPTVIGDALDQLSGNASPNLLTAIDNVRAALSKRLRGTAAIPNTGIAGGASNFSSPGINVGGGSGGGTASYAGG